MNKYFQQWAIAFIITNVVFWMLVFWIYDSETLDKSDKQSIAWVYLILQAMIFIFGYAIPKDMGEDK